MNESKLTAVKLFISILVPLVSVTIGGFIVYKTPSAFFFPAAGQSVTEANGPAVIYYALTLVIALMYFLMRQKFRWYDVVAFCSISLVYSLSLQKMTPGVFRPLYLYFLPLIVFFVIVWLVLKFVFLNRQMRTLRLLIFSLVAAAAFTLAFWLQYTMLKLPAGNDFLQSRFVSGLMLFIFVGFGLSVAENTIVRLEVKTAGQFKDKDIPDND
jgi:hypothetical protein